jgi:hypothetical protein
MMFYRLLPDKAGDKRFYPREADLPTHPADGLLRVIRRMRRHVSNLPTADIPMLRLQAAMLYSS